MNKDEIKQIINISIIMAFSIVLVDIFLFSIPIKIFPLLKSISKGISIASIFWVFYISLGWRLPIFSNIFYRPNVNGTWVGEILSDFSDKNGKASPPITIAITIRQNFLRVHFTTFTKEAISVSYSETFRLNKEEGIKNLTYMYSKDTSQSLSANSQEGATELRLVIVDNKKELKGKYFSNLKTNGTIHVNFISRKYSDSFIHAKGLKDGKF